MKAKRNPSAIVVQQTREESQEQAVARTALSPSLQSALALKDYGSFAGELDLMALVDELRHQINQTIDGDLGRAEAMLTTQAHTLDAIFSNLACRAIRAEYLSGFDTYLKLGLRAQSQCRATWETLATIKNPVGRAYVNQANIAQNQQVNNTAESSRTRENQNLPDELLEDKKHEPDKWLDRGAPKETITADQDVEAVGEIDRSKVA